MTHRSSLGKVFRGERSERIGREGGKRERALSGQRTGGNEARALRSC